MSRRLVKEASWKLAYLFHAEFSDGSTIVQTPEDRSAVEPTKRSAFFDVAQRLDDLVMFSLVNREHVYSVSLEDGHFEIDGVPFIAIPASGANLPSGGRFRLIYFRDHQHDIIIGSDAPILGAHRVAYRIGWEYEIAGKATAAQSIVVQ